MSTWTLVVQLWTKWTILNTPTAWSQKCWWPGSYIINTKTKRIRWSMHHVEKRHPCHTDARWIHPHPSGPSWKWYNTHQHILTMPRQVLEWTIQRYSGSNHRNLQKVPTDPYHSDWWHECRHLQAGGQQSKLLYQAHKTQKIDEVKMIKSPTFIQPRNDYHATKIDYVLVSNNILGTDKGIYIASQGLLQHITTSGTYAKTTG